MKKQVLGAIIVSLIGFSAMAEISDGKFCRNGSGQAMEQKSAEEIVNLIRNKELSYDQVKVQTIQIIKHDIMISTLVSQNSSEEDYSDVARSLLGADNRKEFKKLRKLVNSMLPSIGAILIREFFWLNICE